MVKDLKTLWRHEDLFHVNSSDMKKRSSAAYFVGNFVQTSNTIKQTST